MLVPGGRSQPHAGGFCPGEAMARAGLMPGAGGRRQAGLQAAAAALLLLE